jgi:hypothetical protein
VGWVSVAYKIDNAEVYTVTVRGNIVSEGTELLVVDETCVCSISYSASIVTAYCCTIVPESKLVGGTIVCTNEIRQLSMSWKYKMFVRERDFTNKYWILTTFKS